jgi:legumain
MHPTHPFFALPCLWLANDNDKLISLNGMLNDNGKGVDVYAGCQKDYTGDDVTAANFLAVITGNSAAVKGKKVLKSNANDNVFIFL